MQIAVKKEDYNDIYVPLEVNNPKEEVFDFNKDSFGVEEWIPIDLLMVEEETQRTLMEHQVKKIMREFTPSAFGRVTVSQRGDGYIIADGQHRTEAIRRLGGQMVPCVVVDSSGTKDDARNFIRINENSMQVSAIDKYRIGCKAEIAEWQRVKEVVEDRCNLKVGTGSGVVSAISSIYKYINSPTLIASVHQKMDTMEVALRLLNNAVGVDSIMQTSILAMCILVREYIETNITTEEKFTQRLSNINVKHLIATAQTLKSNGTRGKVVTYLAWLIYTEYNVGLKSNKLPARIEP
ncbi:MAG: ParB N-terminal domain-containing protein [Bacilli bacterium]|uniref:ParB N-terminal domain-containing protein n=1 Tax=Clostridium sp. TaxID=1506 RepID=UPI002FC9FEC4